MQILYELVTVMRECAAIVSLALVPGRLPRALISKSGDLPVIGAVVGRTDIMPRVIGSTVFANTRFLTGCMRYSLCAFAFRQERFYF